MPRIWTHHREVFTKHYVLTRGDEMRLDYTLTVEGFGQQHAISLPADMVVHVATGWQLVTRVTVDFALGWKRLNRPPKVKVNGVQVEWERLEQFVQPA